MRVAMLDPSAFTIPYDVHLCEGLSRTGSEVHLFTRAFRTDDYFSWTRTGQRDDAIDSQTYRIIEHFYKHSENSCLLSRLPLVKRFVKGGEHITNMNSFRRAIRQAPPEVVHFQWMAIPFVDQAFIRRIQIIAPVVLTVHDTNAFLSPSSRLQLPGWHSALRIFDKLIVHTDRSKLSLIEKGIDESRIAIIPHGLLYYGRSESQMNVLTKDRDPSPLSILAFGSIKPYKGLDVLIRALATLPSTKQLRVRIIVAGNSSLRPDELQTLARQCSVDNLIEWNLRFIADHEVPYFFNRCDVAIFPYRAIDASGALMTALPFGKAIIASRIGAFAELLSHGINALLVEPNNVHALAASLLTLIDDRALARALGRNSLKLADTVLTWDEIAKRTLSVYQAASESRLASIRCK